MSLVAKRIRNLGATALLAFPLALGGCSDTSKTPAPAGSPGPTGPSSPSSPAPTTIPTQGPPSAAPLQVFEGLPNLAWVGEGPNGWVMGELGASYRALPEDEIGILAKDNLILSIRYPKEEGLGITLLVRRDSNAEASEIRMGNLIPGSIAIAKDGSAVISGASFGEEGEVPMVTLNLQDPPGEGTPVTSSKPGLARNVAISADGTTVYSSLCELGELELTGCLLQQVFVEQREVGTVSELPGALSEIAAGVGIVAPVTDTNPEFVAGVDLQSGKELWRVEGQIEAWRIVGERELIVSWFEVGDAPRYVVERVDLQSGDRRPLFEQAGDEPPRFWFEQSTDAFLVLSQASDIATALADHPDGLVPVQVIDLKAETVEPFLLFIGKPA